MSIPRSSHPFCLKVGLVGTLHILFVIVSRIRSCHLQYGFPRTSSLRRGEMCQFRRAHISARSSATIKQCRTKSFGTNLGTIATNIHDLYICVPIFRHNGIGSTFEISTPQIYYITSARRSDSEQNKQEYAPVWGCA